MSFTFNFTQEKLAKCIKNTQSASWYPALVDILPKYQINTEKRVSAWLAQCGHESGDFNILQENLNYSAKGLKTVFSKYFLTEEMANQYQRNPEKIANYVYGNRMGNGPENTGDGFKFRGRGLIQITGKQNYTACSEALYGSKILLENPDLLVEIDGAVRSACWFWNSRKLNTEADKEDHVALTKKINGGTHGLDDRIARYNRCFPILNS
jgi:putative chitinase